MPSRPLRVAVDGRELLGRPTGVGRYLGEILDAWHADPDWPHELALIVPDQPGSALATRYPHARWQIEPGAAGTLWEQLRLPRSVARVGADVLFAPAYTGPLRLSCPMVVTIHDLSYFAHPEWFGWREGFRRRWLTQAAARRAAAILTVSEVAGADIVRRLGVGANRVHVVHHGAPPAASERVPAPDPVVLYVGSLFERRHIPELIAGFAAFAAARPTARLVLVGQDRSRHGLDPIALAARHGIAERVVWHQYLPEQALQQQYATARVFAFLSEYEGFGLTPLEAMASGVPAVVLDTAVAREVYGDAATFVALDPAAIARSLALLADDAVLNAEMAGRGHRRLARFSWARAARATRAVLERAAGS
jgi:glycosyltransferase involved in cell wall biosynthesis